MGPLGEKFGLAPIFDMPLAEAFVLSDSVASRAEIEGYHMWRIEAESKQKDKNKGKTVLEQGEMRTLMDSEKDKGVMKRAMASAENFLGLMNNRGLNKYKENVTRKQM